MSSLRTMIAGRGLAFTTLVTAAMLLPGLGVTVSESGTAVLPLLAVLTTSAIATEMTFRLIRKQALTAHNVTTAFILAILLPTEIALWRAATMTVLGVTLSEMIFGGRGFGFLNAAVVIAALVVVSFPGTALASLTDMHAAATAPAVLALAVAGVLPWRALGAFALGCIAMTGLSDTITTTTAWGVLVFGGVFLLADPFASAQTRSGQVLQGVLAAVLFAFLGAGGADATTTLVRAVLLTALFVPLLDQAILTIGRRIDARA
ncbi:NQR2/RnfD/RnfE family subunit of NADH-ubiquinone oxidoreductase [Hoeflea halophila]|uniref:NQR2/RnfD/RnfE family subunit of NADH-ubiquinone oxidoreductase n=1 Tax=Hoeflea halophila TaxID=714899 RepID=A0A286IDY7_9HYPH|nr:RnfABCDGE type electron transport complex subunit D [Hoeflea halophila]SOE18237.1 NQR2/RnfD/RnfE family subunit of NADH-ubiquinone oxidoreductase [Hoeflea halophila]